MAAVVWPSKTTFSPAPTVATKSQDYFDIVTSNLLRLGALTLENFLSDPYQEPTPQENFLSNPLYHNAPLAPPLTFDDQDGENGKPAQTPAPIFVLEQICSQTFGSIDALDYEIIEEEGKEKKRCILTITRPNGATRSYTSKPEFARKAEARAAAAAIAVDMGAIDFIKHGSPEAVAKRGLVLAPLDAPGSVQEPSPRDAEEEPAVKEIEKCCVEWRAGRVKPRWIFLIDSKPTGKYGCALQIKLSLHLLRAFSVDVAYPTFEAAKATCAADAIAEGILDFIKFGNGQTAPAERRFFQSQEDDAMSTSPPVALTLQGFFEALPRPLPEPVDDKSVAEINAPGWLNTLIQSARGGKLEHKFIWTTDTKLGTHGAVLRLTRPREVRTYMVEPQFPKRADAKNAVCLAALAAGVGAYVRSISVAVEAQISPEGRSLALDSILPVLITEYGKFWPNKLPEIFEHTKDRDACGCIMTLKLTEQPEEHEKRSWTAPADFRNKNDAKVAVILLAFKQGAIEFLRFKGEPPPEYYKVGLPAPRESKKAKRKRADGGDDEGESVKKKPKLLSQAEQFLAATLPSKSSTEVRASGPSGPSQARPSTSAAAILLPRPGYIDPKPEPGELPAEPPKDEPEPEPFSATTSWRPPAMQPSREPRAYAPNHPTAEWGPRLRGEPSRSYPHPYGTGYGTGEDGRQYELGDTWYDGPGGYASDPYYAAPPARHAKPWHAHASGPVYPEEDCYGHSRYDVGYKRDGYDYDYKWDPYVARHYPPPPGPAGAPERGFGDFEGSGYDYDHSYAHAHERGYAHTRGHGHGQGHVAHQYPRARSHPEAELGVVPVLAPRRDAVPPSPPRVWKPGPRARGKQGGSGAAHEPVSETAPATASASFSSLSSSSSSSTPAGSSLPNTHAAKPSSASSKEELFECCKARGYPCPRFFDALDDSGNATTAELGGAPAQAPAQYKVWVVLGSERLELPTVYATIKEGEEKMARKVLRHLRSRDAGEAQE